MTSIEYLQSEVQERKNNNNSSSSKDRNMGDVFSKYPTELVHSSESDEGTEVLSEPVSIEKDNFLKLDNLCGNGENSISLDSSDNILECPIAPYESIGDELFSQPVDQALMNHIYTSYKDCSEEDYDDDLCTCDQDKISETFDADDSSNKEDDEFENMKSLSDCGLEPSDASTFYDDFKSSKENCLKSDVSSEVSVSDEESLGLLPEGNDNLLFYSCDFAGHKNTYANSVDGKKILSCIWHELQYGLRVIYKSAFEATDGEKSKIMFQPDINRLRELVGRFYHQDPQLLFRHLKSFVEEFVIEIKVKLVQQLRRDVKLPVLAQQFLRSLLDCYERLWIACLEAFPAMHVFEIDHLSHFNISWELLNKYLYLAHVYTDPMVRNNLPVFISQLRALLSTSEHQRICTKLVQRYLSFDEEMNEIGVKWREAEILINAYSQEQTILRAKQRILQRDPEFFRAHGKLLKQQFEGVEDFSNFIESGHEIHQLSSGKSSHYFTSTLKDFLFSEECPDCHLNKCFCEDCFFNHMATYVEKLQNDTRQIWVTDKDKKSGLKRKHKDEFVDNQPQKPIVDLLENSDGQSCECHVCTALPPGDPDANLKLPDSFDIPINPGSLHLYPHIHGSSDGLLLPPLCDLWDDLDSKLPVENHVDILDTTNLYEDPKLYPGTMKKFWKQFYFDSIVEGLGDVNFDLDTLDEKIKIENELNAPACVSSQPVSKKSGCSGETWCVKAKKKSQAIYKKSVPDNSSKSQIEFSSARVKNDLLSDLDKSSLVSSQEAIPTKAVHNENQPALSDNVPISLPSLARDEKEKLDYISSPYNSLVNGIVESDSSIPPETEDSSSQDGSSSSSEKTASTASLPKDPRHCDCCHCEVFGHGLPSVAPVSRNYPEMRERLRLLLSKKRATVPTSSETEKILLPNGITSNSTHSQSVSSSQTLKNSQPSSESKKTKSNCVPHPLKEPCEKPQNKKDNMHAIPGDTVQNSTVPTSTTKPLPNKQCSATVSKSDQSSQTDQAPGTIVNVKKRLNLPTSIASPAPVKSPPKDPRSLDMLLNYIEGHNENQEPEKKSKKAAKRARQRQRKLEEQAQLSEERQRSEVTITLVKDKEKGPDGHTNPATNPVSLTANRVAKQFLQGQLCQTKIQIPQGSQMKVKLSSHSDNAQNYNPVKEASVPKKNSKSAKKKMKDQKPTIINNEDSSLKSVENPQMVTIRRVMEPNSQEPTVTITLKGETPAQDKVLFTLVNGQVQESNKSGKSNNNSVSSKNKSEKSKKNSQQSQKNQTTISSQKPGNKDQPNTKKSKKQKLKPEVVVSSSLKDKAMPDTNKSKQKAPHPSIESSKTNTKVAKTANSTKKNSKNLKDEKDDIDEIIESLMEVGTEDKKKKKKKKKKKSPEEFKPENLTNNSNLNLVNTCSLMNTPAYKISTVQPNYQANSFPLPYQPIKNSILMQDLSPKERSDCDDDILKNLRLPPGTTITKIQGPAKPSRTMGKPQIASQQPSQPSLPGSNFITVPSVLGGGQQQSVIVVDTNRLREEDKITMANNGELKSSKQTKKEKKKKKKNKNIESIPTSQIQSNIEKLSLSKKEERKVLEPMMNLNNYCASSLFNKVEVMEKVRQNGISLGCTYPGEHSLKLLSNETLNHPGNGYIFNSIHNDIDTTAADSVGLSKKTKKKKKKGKSQTSESKVNCVEMSNTGEKDQFEEELEAFKRFCFSSYPVERREKVNLNVQDIKELLKKKKSVAWNN